MNNLDPLPLTTLDNQRLPASPIDKGGFLRIKAVTLFALLALLLAACGGLGGEPEIIATLPAPTDAPVIQDVGQPEAQPDLALGAEIFAARCTACHGQTGAGDGELVRAGSVESPGDFNDPAQIAGQSPHDYFEIITNGILERMMPPWANALTEEERWAVALYTYTLHYTADQLTDGAEIYQLECAACHGEIGLGDGPEAVDSPRDVGNLADAGAMVFLSDDNIYTIITEGAGDVMPAYDDTLTESQRRAVTAFSRALSVSSNNAMTERQVQVPTPQVETPQAVVSTTGRITGTITNGTTGGTVPANLAVVLHIIDADFNEQTIETTINSDGSYTFADFPVSENMVYFVSTRHQERNFASSPFSINPAVPEVNVPVLIYEVTEDPAVITITSMITQITEGGDLLEVRQDVTFRNTSDRLYATNRDLGRGRTASVDIPLPVGAIVAVLPDEERFVIQQEEFTVTDTRAVLPGNDHNISLIYLLPYDRGAIIEYPVNYQLNGTVIVLIDSETITATSDQLIPIDPEVAPNLQARAYGGNLSLKAGDLIRYELIGRAVGVGTSADSSIITSDNLLPLLLALVGILLLGIAGFIYISKRSGSTPTDNKNALIDGLVRQIAELDTQHDAGQINHDLYRQRRAQLKARLAELIDSPEAPEYET